MHQRLASALTGAATGAVGIDPEQSEVHVHPGAGWGLAPGLSSLRPVLRLRLHWDRSRRCAAPGADHHGHALICRFSVLQA